MIHDHHTQSLSCPHCKECVEIPRSVLSNPERLAIFKQQSRSFHAECASFTDIKLAKANRRFQKGLHFELKRQQRRAPVACIA